MQVLQPLVSHMTDKPTALEFSIKLEFRNVDFCGERKTLAARTTTNNKLNPLINMTPGLGFEPGPQRWEASAITTAPSLLPCCIIK